MLTALNLGNFKAFADLQNIPIKPITLIFGPNSAGKSSIIHSLALAHEAIRKGELDIFRTEVGGNSIDLGGFRQYVHRRQANRRVEWGVSLNTTRLSGRLSELLKPVSSISIHLTVGVALDNEDKPILGASPEVISYEMESGGELLIRMSRRPDGMAVDRLNHEHPVIRQIITAVLESSTTTQTVSKDDYASLSESITDIVSSLRANGGTFLPEGLADNRQQAEDGLATFSLFSVSKGNRGEDLARALRFFLPRSLNELVSGASKAVKDELLRIQYLGPLRSYPPRHLAFSEHDDINWYAGGGYAWDVVRRDDEIRDAVNAWLSSSKLKTPYKLIARALIAADQLKEPLESGLTQIESNDEAMFVGSVDKDGYVMKHFPPKDDSRCFFEDVELSAEFLSNILATSDIDHIRDLVLIDQRTNTVVTHRDVGIGISQVLPVLVMAYGSQRKILAMEQPEIHLHPALQAELGDVFIESALGAQKNTFILETHSEHLILRFMKRMRQTFHQKDTGLPPLTPADVAVLYVEPDGPRSIVREMPLNEMGELVKAWPGGFFEEGIREQFDDA